MKISDVVAYLCQLEWEVDELREVNKRLFYLEEENQMLKDYIYDLEVMLNDD